MLHMLQNLKVTYHMFHWQPFDKTTEAHALYASMFDEIKFAPFDANEKSLPMSSRNLTVLAKENYQSVAGPDWPSLEHILDNSYLEQDIDKDIASEVQKFLDYLSQDPRFKSHTYQTDSHPSPTKHLAWAKKYLPQYDISKATVDWVSNIEHKLMERQPYNFDSTLT